MTYKEAQDWIRKMKEQIDKGQNVFEAAKIVEEKKQEIIEKSKTTKFRNYYI